MRPIMGTARALEEACRVLAGFVRDAEDTARNSYTQLFPGGQRVFTDAMWQKAEPDVFRLVQRARRLLRRRARVYRRRAPSATVITEGREIARALLEGRLRLPPAHRRRS